MEQPNRKQRRANKKGSKPQNQIQAVKHEPSNDRFSQFAQRAKSFGIVPPEKRNAEPFILGPEQGFDPPVEIHPPTVEVRDQLVRLTSDADFYAAARVLVGSDYDRVIKVLGEWERTNADGVTGEIILCGIFIEAMEHFFGKGAASPFFSG